VEGTWTDHEVALEEFRGWLGIHGSRWRWPASCWRTGGER